MRVVVKQQNFREMRDVEGHACDRRLDEECYRGCIVYLTMVSDPPDNSLPSRVALNFEREPLAPVEFQCTSTSNNLFKDMFRAMIFGN